MKAYSRPAGNSSKDILALRRLVAGTVGRLFSVLFVSRGRNEPRKMRARLKALSRAQVIHDLRNHQFTVWDMDKKDTRTIPLERVVLFQCGKALFLTGVGDSV